MIGRRVSHYKVLAKLGKGGMGEVYLAEDTSFSQRKVALKFLPAELEEDEIARRRFLREAQSAATLEHPFICNFKEVSQTESGQDFIVMEYVDGRTLKEELDKGPIALKRALQIGVEAAEALEVAHQKGIVHRDLKPANTMLTPHGHAKVMDFGLAKKVVTEDGREQDISSALTREGSTLGTLSYMSPEQIRGEAVDTRSDIFSLGLVIYEIVTGVHPFRRSRPAETTSAILREDPPPPARYADDLPDLLRHTLLKMLAKEAVNRYQSVHEVLTNLNQLREDSGKVGLVEVREFAPANRLWMAMVVLLGPVVLWILWPNPETQMPDLPMVRFSLQLPVGEHLAAGSAKPGTPDYFMRAVEVSPDGRWIAYVSYVPGEGGAPDGDPVINLRRLDRREVRRIPGYNPFFSPDSRQLGFVRWDKSEETVELMRTNVAGASTEVIVGADSRYIYFGCAWLPDNRIVFTPHVNGGLSVVPAVGGEVRTLTRLDRGLDEVSHRLPSYLPDGRTILYTVVRFSSMPDWSLSRIVAFRPDTSEPKVLIEGGSSARYVASGHLLFAREGRLMAIRFDPEELEVAGDAVPVIDNVIHSVHVGNSPLETGAAQFAVSRSGLLAFGPGGVYPQAMRDLVWVSGQGQEEPVGIDPHHWLTARLSREGHQILLTTNYRQSESGSMI